MADIETQTVDALPKDWEARRLARMLREQQSRLRQEYAIDGFELFGSYVRNEQQPGSDLDIIVNFARTPSLFDLVGLRDELTELLGVPVDITLRSTLSPRLARYIDREALPL